MTSQTSLQLKLLQPDRVHPFSILTPTMIGAVGYTIAVESLLDSAEDLLLDPSTRLCPFSDWKVLTRVIGCHSRKLSPNLNDTSCETVVVAVGDKQHDKLRIVRYLTLPGNVNMLIAEEPMQQYKRRLQRDLRSWHISERHTANVLSKLSSGGIHTIFAINWFSPQSWRDYVNLGLKLITQRGLDTKFGLTGPQFLQLAEDLLWSPAVMAYINDRNLRVYVTDTHGTENHEIESSYWDSIETIRGQSSTVSSTESESEDVHVGQPSTEERKSPISLITCTGFSMGGAIGQVMAYLLRETRKLTVPLRAVGIGSPRPGNGRFNSWYNRNLALGSCNIILVTPRDPDCMPESDIYMDPASSYPSLSNGYTEHPICILLYKHTGLCRFMKAEDRNLIKKADLSLVKNVVVSIPGISPLRDQLWKSLHRISIYYDTLCRTSGNTHSSHGS